MRGICLSKENALFFGIALRHMTSVYNKPAQEVAPTGLPGKTTGLPRLRTSVSPGTFPRRGGGYAQICVTPVRRVFEGSASISEAHLESFCPPNE